MNLTASEVPLVRYDDTLTGRGMSNKAHDRAEAIPWTLGTEMLMWDLNHPVVIRGLPTNITSSCSAGNLGSLSQHDRARHVLVGCGGAMHGSNFYSRQFKHGRVLRRCDMEWGELMDYIGQNEPQPIPLQARMGESDKLSSNTDTHVTHDYPHVVRWLQDSLIGQLFLPVLPDMPPLLTREMSLLWVATANTRTALHHDPWVQTMLQCTGRKHFWFLPLLNEHNKGFSVDFERHAWETKGPLQTCVGNSSLQWLQARDLRQVTMHEGDMLFLPYGWAHDVYTLDNSISVTFRTKRDHPAFGFNPHVPSSARSTFKKTWS